MENKLFIENKNSLGEYLLSLGQQFKVTSKTGLEVVRSGKGSNYKSIVSGIESKFQPIFQVILKDEGNDLIRILVPEHTIYINLKYSESGTLCYFEYKLPQTLIKFPINLKDLAKDFDTAEDLVNEQVIKVINNEFKELFNGKVFDSKDEWTLTGKVKPTINIQYNTK